MVDSTRRTIADSGRRNSDLSIERNYRPEVTRACEPPRSMAISMRPLAFGAMPGLCCSTAEVLHPSGSANFLSRSVDDNNLYVAIWCWDTSRTSRRPPHRRDDKLWYDGEPISTLIPLTICGTAIPLSSSQRSRHDAFLPTTGTLTRVGMSSERKNPDKRIQLAGGIGPAIYDFQFRSREPSGASILVEESAIGPVGIWSSPRSLFAAITCLKPAS